MRVTVSDPMNGRRLMTYRLVIFSDVQDGRRRKHRVSGHGTMRDVLLSRSRLTGNGNCDGIPRDLIVLNGG